MAGGDQTPGSLVPGALPLIRQCGAPSGLPSALGAFSFLGLASLLGLASFFTSCLPMITGWEVSDADGGA